MVGSHAYNATIFPQKRTQRNHDKPMIVYAGKWNTRFFWQVRMMSSLLNPQNMEPEIRGGLGRCFSFSKGPFSGFYVEFFGKTFFKFEMMTFYLSGTLVWWDKISLTSGDIYNPSQTLGVVDVFMVYFISIVSTLEASINSMHQINIWRY